MDDAGGVIEHDDCSRQQIEARVLRLVGQRHAQGDVHARTGGRHAPARGKLLGSEQRDLAAQRADVDLDASDVLAQPLDALLVEREIALIAATLRLAVVVLGPQTREPLFLGLQLVVQDATAVAVARALRIAVDFRKSRRRG